MNSAPPPFPAKRYDALASLRSIGEIGDRSGIRLPLPLQPFPLIPLGSPRGFPPSFREVSFPFGVERICIRLDFDVAFDWDIRCRQ